MARAWWCLGGALALVVVLVTSTAAQAQDETGDGAATGDESGASGAEGSGAADGGDAEAQAETEGASEEEDPTLAEARERIARGEQLYESGDYDAALAEFRRVYDLLEGHPLRPLVLFNIGKCYEKLFRYDQAMEHFRRYLEQAGPEAEDRAEVRAKIELLEGLLGTVTIEVDVPRYEVWVDENLVGENRTEVLVPGGSHTVEIRAPGYVPARQQVQVPARAERTLTFELEELAEEYRGVDPLYFWGSAGLAVAAAVVGMGFGVKAIKERNRIDGKLDDPVLQWSVTEDDRAGVQDLQLKADVFFGVAGVFAASALVLAFLTDWSAAGVAPPGEGEEAGPQARLRVSPVAGAETAGVILEGTF